MSKVKDYSAARGALEYSIGVLMDRARGFRGDGTGTSVRELLAAGREYGRALSRVERMRARK